MRYLKTFENYGESPKGYGNNTYDLSDLRHIEEWIKSVWDRISEYNLSEGEEGEIGRLFQQIENRFDESTANIIERMYDADKLHYFQRMNDEDYTGEFIRSFEEIKAYVDETLETYARKL